MLSYLLRKIPVQESNDLPTGAGSVGGKGGGAGASSNTLFDRPCHGLGALRACVHIGKGGGAGGGTACQFPQVSHGSGAGARRVAAKGGAGD